MDKFSTQSIKTLFSGSLIGQLINFLTLYLISLLYQVEVLGQYFILIAIVQMCVPFISLQSHLIILLGKTEEEHREFLNKSIMISIALGLLLFLILGIILLFIEPFSIVAIESNVFIYIPVAAMLSAINLSLENILTSQKRYPLIRNGRIIKAIILLVVQSVVALLFRCTVHLLVIGYLLSVTVTVGFFLFATRELYQFIHLRQMRQYIVRFKHVFIHNTAIAALSIGSSQLPYILLGYLYSSELVGYFGMAVKIVSSPFGLFGSNIGQVFFQVSAKMHNQQLKIKSYLKKTYFVLLKTGAIPFFILLALGPWGVNLFLGNNWEMTGVLIQITLFWIFMTYVTTSIDTIYTILGKQKYLTGYQILMLIARLGCIIICGYFKVDFVLTIGIFTLISVIFNFINQYIIFRMTQIYDTRISLP